MPKYRFECEKCCVSVERYVPVSTETLPCKTCSSSMRRLLPNIGSKKVTETVDSFLNIRQEEDHKKKLEERRTRYFWDIEVPRMIESGTYSIATCLQEGWLVYDERGKLVLGKGPPQKK